MKLSHSIVCSALLSFSQLSLALPQFINEFHYDNVGADVEEYVEIAGLAGSDLAGWRLDFYNGDNGKVYSSWALSGLISDEGNGWGALSFSGGSIQNGPNDGIALVDSLGDLIQFISYEGELTGVEGVASGVTSMDIGIAESGATPLGYSLQLSGSGAGMEDFYWIQGVSSFGSLNQGQQFYLQTPPAAYQAVSEPYPLGLLMLGLAGMLARRVKQNAA